MQTPRQRYQSGAFTNVPVHLQLNAMKAENDKLVAANTAFKQDLEIGEVRFHAFHCCFTAHRKLCL